jgi:hypothetical protein
MKSVARKAEQFESKLRGPKAEAVRAEIKAYHAKKRSVDILENEMDNLACLLGAFGQNTMAIAKATGLTKHQVTYRLTRGSVRRRDWTAGISPIYELVVKMAQRRARAVMNAKIRMDGGLVIADARA